MNEDQDRAFAKGVFFLTIAGLISKLLSAAYRIPLQNLTGDMGFYIYQQVYPFLGMIIILSLYGFPSAIAKIIAELQVKGKQMSVRSVYVPLLTILFSFMGVISIVLWMNAHTIASWMGDTQLTIAYKWVAIACLMVPFLALLRGVFQGFMQMNIISYSQIGEQIVRVGMIMTAAYVVATQNVNVYQIGTFGVLASIVGALVAIAILLISLRKSSFHHRVQFQIPWRYYIRTLFLFGVVASLNHMVLLLIQFADVFTLVPGLVKHGLPQVDAMEQKGIFDRGQPLIQLGTVLGSSFALAIIPAISRHTLSKSLATIQSSLKMSFYLATGAVIGLVFIFEETNTLLYQNSDGTSSLQVLSLSIFLSSLSITCLAILQSLGYLKRSALFILGALVVKWISNLALVPLWGIMGSAISTVTSLFVLFIACFLTLRRHIQNIHYRKIIHFQPLVTACGGMIVFLLAVKFLIPYELITTRIGLLFYVGAVSVIGASIYLFLLLYFQAFSKREIEMLPFSSFFMRFYKGRDEIE